ncbi:MAG: zinc-dependent peptidase [Saprospiraceae bacterium]|nr:zinc-dependent peptidase [Saprospiraceae bacterium]
MKLSGILYIIAFVLGGVIVFIEFVYYSGDFVNPYLVIPLALGIGSYVLAPQLDWWYSKHFPPKLEDKVRQIFESNSLFYRNLPPERRKIFDERICLFVEAKDWQYIGMEGELPYDVRSIIAFEPVRLTLAQNNFLMKPFDRIAVYPNPFITPVHPDRYHASEIYPEDGMAIFSLKHIMPAFRHPTQYFNVVLYEFAKIMIMSYPDIIFPQLDDHFWPDLYKVANYGKREIMGAVGLPDIEPLPVAIHHYYIYGEYFGDVYPTLYGELRDIFEIHHLPLHRVSE